MALFKKEISKLLKELKDRLTILLNKENIEFVLDENITTEYNDTASGRIYLNIEIDIYKDNQTREKVKNLTKPLESKLYYLGDDVNIHDVIELKNEILELNVSFAFHNQYISEPEQIEICNRFKSEFEIMGNGYFNLILQKFKKEFFKFIVTKGFNNGII